MTILHMETEQVREVAGQMEYQALTLLEQEEALRDASIRLETAWQSDGAAGFLGEFRSLLSRYRTQAEELQALALRLQKEVEEWELAAQPGMASAYGGIPAPGSIDASVVWEVGGSTLPFDWTKPRDKTTESILKFLEKIPYDSRIRPSYKGIGRWLNQLVGNQKAGFVGFMDRFGHVVKSPAVKDGIPLGLGIWADHRESHDWKHALGSEAIEFGVDKAIYAIPYAGVAYGVYNIGLALGYLGTGVLEITGHHETALKWQETLDQLDISERLGDAIYDFIAHPPTISLDLDLVARLEAHFACGF